jgi:8-oxo-dGTP diphosphatase
MNNKGFYSISNEQLVNTFKSTSRQYLVGNLKLPQIIEHLHDENIEIGITEYKEFKYEMPHYHTKATEYQYMLEGMTEYIDVDTNEKVVYRKGDFYAIHPYTKYAQRSKAGTKIIFIKSPGLNDKVSIDETDETLKWKESPFPNKRVDHYYSSEAPIPNSIKPAAAVAILNDHREILLIKRKDNGKWSMPGGSLDFGESLTECAVREVKEETNLFIEIKDIIGTYTNPSILVEYSDGEVRQEFTIVYFGTAINFNEVKIDGESTKYEWVSLEEIHNLNFADSQKRRIADVIEYIKSGKKALS